MFKILAVAVWLQTVTKLKLEECLGVTLDRKSRMVTQYKLISEVSTSDRCSDIQYSGSIGLRKKYQTDKTIETQVWDFNYRTGKIRLSLSR